MSGATFHCPLCDTKWSEGPVLAPGGKVIGPGRERGSCPGCGAGMGEMFRALYRLWFRNTRGVK